MLISWGGPDERRTEICSYCDEPLPDNDDFVPLILTRGDGWCAEFCEKCQERWWGFHIVRDEGDEDGIED
jgi:hypothetical protein